MNNINNQKLNNVLIPNEVRNQGSASKASRFFKDPNTNWKYIAIVAVVGLIALTGILAYQNSGLTGKSISLPGFLTIEQETPETPKQPQIPSDWKAYRNEEYGLEIKYPRSTRVVLENMPLENKDLVLVRLGLTEPDTPPDQDMGFPSFDIAVRRERKNIDSYINEYKSQFDNPQREGYTDPSLCKEKELRFGAGSYRAVELSDCSVFGTKFIFIQHPILKDTIIQIAFSELGHHFLSKDKANLLYQIFSTFKFLDNVQIKKWKAYNNSKYNFTLGYPSDFYVQIDNSKIELELDKIVVAVRLAKSADINYPIVNVSVTKTNLTSEEWLNVHRCASKAIPCSHIYGGALPGSLRVHTSRGAHYRSIDTVFKQNDILFDISVNATKPDSAISNDALVDYNQILSTFKFLE